MDNYRIWSCNEKKSRKVREIFSGNWKVSHNIVKNIFSDIIVTSYFDSEDFLNIWAVNDNFKEDYNCSVILELFAFD